MTVDMTGPNPNRIVEPDPEKWKKILDEMIEDEDGSYNFAMEFLESVRDQITEKGSITNKQTKGILNIRRSADRI